MAEKRPSHGETMEAVITGLRTDPVYLARRAEQDSRYAAGLAGLRAEQVPLVADLHHAGYEVGLVSDLYPLRSYPKAIPILLKHLVLPYSEATREAIARALATPEARHAWPILVAEYRKAPVAETSTSKDGLAVALAATATKERLPELIDLLRDRSHGRTRALLLGPLKRSRTEMARKALDELRTDPDLATEIGTWARGARTAS